MRNSHDPSEISTLHEQRNCGRTIWDAVEPDHQAYVGIESIATRRTTVVWKLWCMVLLVLIGARQSHAVVITLIGTLDEPGAEQRIELDRHGLASTDTATFETHNTMGGETIRGINIPSGPVDSALRLTTFAGGAEFSVVDNDINFLTDRDARFNISPMSDYNFVDSIRLDVFDQQRNSTGQFAMELSFNNNYWIKEISSLGNTTLNELHISDGGAGGRDFYFYQDETDEPLVVTDRLLLGSDGGESYINVRGGEIISSGITEIRRRTAIRTDGGTFTAEGPIHVLGDGRWLRQSDTANLIAGAEGLLIANSEIFIDGGVFTISRFDRFSQGDDGEIVMTNNATLYGDPGGDGALDSPSVTVSDKSDFIVRAGGQLLVGKGRNSTVTVENPESRLKSDNLYLGADGGTGTVIFRDRAEGEVPAVLSLGGDMGNGVLRIESGATVLSARGDIGSEALTSGAATVTGSGSRWSITNDTNVGNYGTGILAIENGGYVNSLNSQIGRQDGSTGEVTVVGAGSVWTSRRYLYVGTQGVGALTIQDGGSVNVGDRAEAGATPGWLTVSHSTDMDNWGRLLVRNGSTLNHGGSAVLGDQAGEFGFSTVSGAGSIWSNRDDLYVGKLGLGTLSISDGGSVLIGDAALSGSTPGWLTVSDASNTDGAGVGGSLYVRNGSTLTHGGSAVLGDQSGEYGYATVTGEGSQWSNTGNLHVGREGSGRLEILDNGRVSVGDFTNSNVTPGSLIISDVTNTTGSGNGGHLYINSGSELVNWGVTVLGDEDNEYGYATVRGTGSHFEAMGSLYVGAFGLGEVNVEAGGQVDSTGVTIGRNAFSLGSATVTDAMSRWSSDTILIGDQGAGGLSIRDGGTLESQFGAIGLRAASSGSASVRGEGSTWSNTGVLQIGVGGFAQLEIESGGRLATYRGELGSQSGGAGTATVMGLGSILTSTTDLQLGSELGGVGTLSISDGGSVHVGDSAELGSTPGWLTVSDASNTDGAGVGGSLYVRNGSTLTHSGSAVLGDQSGEFGYATVTGVGSTWTSNGNLIVGNAGEGTLMVADGGFASNGLAFIGNALGGEGRVTVSGEGSRWENTGGGVRVGENGAGRLEVQDGGVVESVLSTLGTFADGSGVATVTGVGSWWTHSGDLEVGTFGSGVLTVEAGGGVTSSNGLISHFAGSSGTATVAGVGSTWSNRDDLYVGKLGLGTLSISDGGSVLIGDAALSGSTPGWLTVSDASNTDGAGVGGSLYVRNGSTLTHGGSAVLGDQSGEFGYATVRGAGSVWSNAEALRVGDGGSGALLITLGGGVSTATGAVVIANRVGSSGELEVEGADSSLEVGSFLTVGNRSTGTLSVSEGAAVSGTNGIIGRFAGAHGTATVSGAGSTWTNSLNLTIGGNGTEAGGTGTMNLENGGHVSVADNLFMPNGSASLNFSLASPADLLLDVGGDALLGGLLGVSLDGASTLSEGDAFTLIDIGGTRTGVFSNYGQHDLLGTFNGVDLFLSYTGGDGNDVVAYTTLLAGLVGDYSGDGFVSQSDLDLVLLNWGDAVVPAGFDEAALPGGGPFDGLVSQNELDGVLLNWGSGNPPNASGIPEPTTAGLLALLCAALGVRRRRAA